MIKSMLGSLLSLVILAISFNSVNAGCFHTVGTCSGISCGPVCCATQQECNTYLGSIPNSNVKCNGGDGINTAIGCIPIDNINSTSGWFLGWGIGIGGGVAFILIIYSTFMIMTSQGDPARLKTGHEILTSAISGLIMLIFSVFILKFIGFDILRLDTI